MDLWARLCVWQRVPIEFTEAGRPATLDETIPWTAWPEKGSQAEQDSFFSLLQAAPPAAPSPCRLDLPENREPEPTFSLKLCFIGVFLSQQQRKKPGQLTEGVRTPCTKTGA